MLKSRIAEEVVEKLQELIFDQTFQPGDKLPSERSLSERLGVNRTSLREAIKKLEHLGLVRSRQGDGTRVLDYMSTAGMELAQFLIPFALGPKAQEGAAGRRGLAQDFLEVRQILGREMARLAARRATEQDVNELLEVHGRAKAVVEEAFAGGVEASDEAERALLELDFEFYAVLARATQNRLVQLLTNPLRRAVSVNSRFFAPLNPAPERILEHHVRIIEAVAAHDPTRAAAAAEEYLGAMLERVIGQDVR